MARTKSIIHKTKKCGGTYDVLHTESSIPYLQCDNCGHEVKDWIKWDEEYKDYWQDDAKWEEKKNHITCLLGLFAEHFRRHYEFEYSWSLNDKGLFRGAESNILRRVYNSFDGDVAMVRKYIDWHFEFKVKRRKKRITSLSFLAVPAAMNEFKIHYKKSRTITRDKILPKGMLKWIHDHVQYIEQFNMQDYGDLKHLLEVYKSGRMAHVEPIELFITELQRQNVILSDWKIRNWRENA